MDNTNMKILKNIHSIAEFLILPSYKRCHLGKKNVAFKIFDMYKCNWEVEPILNSKETYYF